MPKKAIWVAGARMVVPDLPTVQSPLADAPDSVAGAVFALSRFLARRRTWGYHTRTECRPCAWHQRHGRGSSCPA